MYLYSVALTSCVGGPVAMMSCCLREIHLVMECVCVCVCGEQLSY